LCFHLVDVIGVDAIAPVLIGGRLPQGLQAVDVVESLIPNQFVSVHVPLPDPNRPRLQGQREAIGQVLPLQFRCFPLRDIANNKHHFILTTGSHSHFFVLWLAVDLDLLFAYMNCSMIQRLIDAVLVGLGQFWGQSFGERESNQILPLQNVGRKFRLGKV